MSAEEKGVNQENKPLTLAKVGADPKAIADPPAAVAGATSAQEDSSRWKGSV